MNNLIKDLSRIGAIKEDNLQLYHPRVRDREDVSVLKDSESEVIVLSKSNHVSDTYYKKRTEKDTYTVEEKEVVTPRLEDNIRRVSEFGSYIRNKRWIDFGCGLGGMLDEISSDAAWSAGIELSKLRADIVRQKGHRVFQSLGEVEDSTIDIITMFHVLEHLTEPVETLENINKLLRPGGILLVEVPHARDALFSLYDCDAFKKFTFWSEHLVLHTRQSLSLIIKSGGFSRVEVSGYQRYPLENHLYWLAMQKPGGHDVWRFMSSSNLHYEYENSLSRIDRTDSLIAICTK